MPEISVAHVPDVTCQPHAVSTTAWQLRRGEYLELDRAADTGVRLKYYSRRADVAYWTALWKELSGISYARELRGHLPHQLRNTFARWVKPGARTLEAGCGLGRFTVAAHALGYRAEGLDWSRETVESLCKRFPSIRWHVGDVRQLHFATGIFDAVYSPGVCEHFEDGPTQVLQETRRILRSGGIAVVSTPCFNGLLQRHVTTVTTNVRPAGCDFYQYAFTPDGLTALLERLGFEVLQVRPYAVLDTFVRYRGWRMFPRLLNALALPMDYLPVLRNWGSTCIWVARKC